MALTAVSTVALVTLRSQRPAPEHTCEPHQSIHKYQFDQEERVRASLGHWRTLVRLRLSTATLRGLSQHTWCLNKAITIYRKHSQGGSECRVRFRHYWKFALDSLVISNHPILECQSRPAFSIPVILETGPRQGRARGIHV